MSLTDSKRLVSRLDVKGRVRACEEWWFETTRWVKTAGDEKAPEASGVVGEIRDSHIYAPVRAANAHAALRDLPTAIFRSTRLWMWGRGGADVVCGGGVSVSQGGGGGVCDGYCTNGH